MSGLVGFGHVSDVTAAGGRALGCQVDVVEWPVLSTISSPVRMPQ